MALNLEYGSCGYQVAAMPHVPRSARGKRSSRRRSDEPPMCAFDLLAAVAGHLLTGGEAMDQDSCNESGTRCQLYWLPGAAGNSPAVVKSEDGSVKTGGGDSDHGSPLVEMEDGNLRLSPPPPPPPPLVSSESSGEMPARDNGILPSGKRELDLLGERNGDGSGTSGRYLSDRRLLKKLLGSRLWRTDSIYRDVERKPRFRHHKVLESRHRVQRSAFKRRKLLLRRRSFSSLAEAKFETGRVPSPTSSVDLDSRNVKLSIKSFKVPELLVAIPENATVGLLKRTVTEALAALLGGDLLVGVQVHGKMVKDDAKTLRQAGISHGTKLENLGFSLEPDRGVLALEPSTTPKVETIQNPASMPPVNSQPIVPVAPEALVAVPQRKAKKAAEHGQRRIRRPFSVPEVEALVQAVEMLGTGRWRDVKLQAFDDAKHRTYVDLKDKWKTLVHTASISPQQRRGEPVPQALLDRVLSAQSFWSQRQYKLHPAASDSHRLLL